MQFKLRKNILKFPYFPSEKILGEIRWNQAFHALNANSGPAKFLALNNFGVSTPDSELSFVFVAFPLLVKI